MSGRSLNLSRLRVAVLGLALAAPSVALAQLAPVIGDHYAARESDTGFVGGVSGGGGYGTSVPLDLPGARGGLKVPVQVVYGGRRFGAAGLGWDVPLSFIRRDVRVAHRRPANIPNASPQPREQLTLDGMALVRKADDTGWVARRNDAQLEVRDVGGGVFESYDGNGTRYSFSSRPAGASQPLDNGNLYLLQDIFGKGGTHVHLDYTIGTPTLAGSVTGLSIDLASVSYNYDSTGSCAKHQVSMFYDSDAPAPVSISMLGTTPLVRLHHLFAVVVFARESADDSSQPCSGAMKALRGYNLNYQNDADTGQLQLSRVTMFGKDDTPERFINLPVATYSYGQVTDPDNKLHYKLSQRITALPDGYDSKFDATFGDIKSFGIAFTEAGFDDGAAPPVSVHNLLDINGDGRPDLLYSPTNFLDFFTAGMTAALNKPDPADPTKSVFTPINIPSRGGEPTGDRFDERQTTATPRQMDIDGSNNKSERWHQLMDMNGDGRVDVVVANELVNKWVIYLNKPDPQDPNLVTWVRREIDIRPLYGYLPGTTEGFFLPLSSSVSGHDKRFNHCWRWDGSRWNQDLFGYTNNDPQRPLNKCAFGPQGQNESAPGFGSIDLSDTSIVQWELRDINGDGYPDLVFNTSPVSQLDAPNPEPFGSGSFVGQFRETQVTRPFDLPQGTTVNAVLNVAGVHLGSSQSIFSTPIVLDTGCGVARWTSDIDAAGRSASTQQCGFADINGDGLADRVTFGGTARTRDRRFDRAVFRRIHPVARACRALGIHPGVDRRSGTLEAVHLPGTTARSLAVSYSNRDLFGQANSWLQRYQWRRHSGLPPLG